jgi:predicted thioredoxin/glutaredoxin
MKNESKIKIDIKGYSHDYDCHTSYRLNDFEKSNPKMLAEIVKSIEAQLDGFMQMKEEANERQA